MRAAHCTMRSAICCRTSTMLMRNELGNRSGETRSGETRSDSNHFAAANANDRSFRHIDARGRSATGHCVQRALRAGGRMFGPRTRQPLAQTLPGKKAGVRKELANLNHASVRFGDRQGAPVVVKRPRHGPAHEVVGVTVSRTGLRHGQSGMILAECAAAFHALLSKWRSAAELHVVGRGTARGDRGGGGGVEIEERGRAGQE